MMNEGQRPGRSRRRNLGPDFPSATVRVLKEKRIRQHGVCRTARLVLATWDRLTTDGTFRNRN